MSIDVQANDTFSEENGFYDLLPEESSLNGSVKSEKTLNSKCSKYLKKKLKKYKIRKNGEEDPDVLNVSELLNLSFVFEAPSPNTNTVEGTEEKPLNYITKMVKHKQKSLLNKNEKAKTKELEKEKKKPKNAFAVMMDSRNKSIGTNSPGKDKVLDEQDSSEIQEKKKNKVKRSLALQKMAEAKGALKKKVVEEQNDEYVKLKMKKRAERLKKMITAKPAKNNKSEDINTDEEKEEIVEVVAIVEEDNIIADTDDSKSNTPQQLKDVDLFSPKREQIAKEDEEFIKKLSPSIRKKENMLCYFKKVPKSPPSTEKIEMDLEQDNKNVEIIKVKLTPRHKKKKTKKSKLSLTKSQLSEPEIIPNDAMDCNENNCNTTNIDISLERVKKEEAIQKDDTETGIRKRKRKEILDIDVLPVNIDGGRPKRNTKKPVKYTDDINLSLSDDELHIFTPRKKKHLEDGDKTVPSPKPLKSKKTLAMNKSKNDEDYKVENDKKKSLEPNKNKGTPKKQAKLAPIFKAKSEADIAAHEARQKFLHSGVPDKLKKIMNQQATQKATESIFSKVVHVQQLDEANIPLNNFKIKEMCTELSINDTDFYKDMPEIFEKLLSCDLLQKEHKRASELRQSIQQVLQYIKDSYPEFPVYRTYKSLKSKCNGDHSDFNPVDLDNSKDILNSILDLKNEDPKNLSWTEKYRATSTKQIIGNFDSIKELKRWLVSWIDNNMTNKNSQGKDSDSSDFYQSDTDSRDGMANTNNLLIVTGPSGSGKTSSIYAVANELAIKVIEVNVSSRRTGKILLQDLQEATQSHKVNRGKGSSAENSQNSQNIFESNNRQKKEPKKKKKNSQNAVLQRHDSVSQSQNNQEEGRTGMSLILIDDADIVFEQDDGFISAITQIVQFSKRPVVLVTSSLSSSNLQKFYQCGFIIKLKPLLPRMLGTWLDILCLADTGVCWPGLGALTLESSKGDIRKSINSLQFLVTSEASLDAKPDIETADEVKFDCDANDETSNMSWAGNENSEGRAIEKCNHGDIFKMPEEFLVAAINRDYFSKWWSIDQSNVEDATVKENKEMQKDLDSLAETLDNFSFTNCFINKVKPHTEWDVTSSPWLSTEMDSVSEKSNTDEVNNSYEICTEISKYLLDMSSSSHMSSSMNGPNSIVRRDREKTLSRHNTLSESLIIAPVMDRRALALDYWSSLRTICRCEKTKTDNNYKRNNRFCHYLKTSKTAYRSDIFNKICYTLEVSDGSA